MDTEQKPEVPEEVTRQAKSYAGQYIVSLGMQAPPPAMIVNVRMLVSAFEHAIMWGRDSCPRTMEWEVHVSTPAPPPSPKVAKRARKTETGP